MPVVEMPAPMATTISMMVMVRAMIVDRDLSRRGRVGYLANAQASE